MMSTKKDYYEILGVPKGSSIDEIKKAYRQLVMKHHPDRVPQEQKKEAEERFKEISEAYAVLSDPQKKELYDKYGHAGIDSRYSTEDIFRGADFSSFFGGGLGDIFENLFSEGGFDIFGGSRGGTRQRRQARGEDVQIKLTIDLEDAAAGAQKDITYWRYDSCSECGGSGAAKGSSKVNCPTCGGRGVVRGGMGFISFSQACPNCGGEGKVIKDKCRACGGLGRIRVKKNLNITVPEGVDNGSILRLRNEGSFAGTARGDLYVHIAVRPHPTFKREGDNIKCKVKISVIKAILGAEIEVPTLDKKVKMKIPSGTQPNTVFRLKNKGIINLRTKRMGDELVEVEVEVPKKTSFKERRLLQEWGRLKGEL